MSANPSRESGDMQSTDKTKQYLMTEGPIHQRVLRYAIPVFIGYLFQQLYNTADALIVGNLVGRNALAKCPLQPEFRLSYTVKDPEAAKNELLGKAVADAQQRALVLTQAAGITLKDIQSIDYSWAQINFEVEPMSRMLMAEDWTARESTATT